MANLHDYWALLNPLEHSDELWNTLGNQKHTGTGHLSGKFKWSQIWTEGQISYKICTLVQWAKKFRVHICHSKIWTACILIKIDFCGFFSAFNNARLLVCTITSLYINCIDICTYNRFWDTVSLFFWTTWQIHFDYKCSIAQGGQVHVDCSQSTWIPHSCVLDYYRHCHGTCLSKKTLWISHLLTFLIICLKKQDWSIPDVLIHGEMCFG